LYEYMKQVFTSDGCKILYTDTDSIIYLYPRGRDPIKSGEYLGVNLNFLLIITKVISGNDKGIHRL
jgi:hypothetical protein